MRDWELHIDSNPKILYGKPVVKGTRIPVSLILEKLAAGDELSDLLDAYPHISKEDILACLMYASEIATRSTYPNENE